MKIPKVNSFNFPKWFLVCNNDLPENYSIHKSKSGHMIYSDNTLCMHYSGKKISFLVLSRISEDDGYSFRWGNAKNINEKTSIKTEDIIMWTFVPSEKYLKEKYVELLEINSDIQ